MKNNIRNALEVLKRATLEVLYEQHINGLDRSPYRQYLRIKEVRERLGIPGFGKHPNDMICHFLLHLENDGYAKYTAKDQWEITAEGIKDINE